MKKLYLLFIWTTFCASCNLESTKTSELQGHYYFVKPLTSLMKTKELMTLHSTVHHYISSSEVEVTQYIGKEPVKTEVMKYSISGNTYDIDGERYEIKKDTGKNFILFVNSLPSVELKYIK